MNTTCGYRSWMIIEFLFYLTEAYRCIYYSKGSTVLLKCSSYFEWMEWIGPAHTQTFPGRSVITIDENRRMWKVTAYTEGQLIDPTLPHGNRLKVIKRVQAHEFDLQIINASNLDEGPYFCGNVKSLYNFHRYHLWNVLKMMNKPVVSSMHNMIEEINEGELKKLCCYVESNATTTKWLNGSLEIFVTHNVTEICYTIEKVSRYDHGNYTCIAENIVGSGSVSVVLKVNYKPVVSYLQDIIEEIIEGKTKKFCCVVDSNPSPISTRWLNGSHQILVTHFVKETCYTINNVSRYDHGNYTCIADNIIGSGSITTVLKVKYKPLVSSMDDLIEEINEGAKKKLCCFVDSNPRPTCTKWLNGSQEILVALNVTETCYSFENVSRYDHGNYTCIAENIIGSGSITTVLKVNYKPLVSILYDLIEEINEGEQTKLCCYVDSNPTPTSTRWLNGIKELLVTHYVNKTCYTIKRVNRYDQGNYTCIAENIIGIGSVSIVLKVKYKPEVSSSHDLIEEINEGKTKTLCCYVDSNPIPISTRWLNGSQEMLVTHNVAKTCYTIKNVSRYDQGNYTCIAHNTIGNGSFTTLLQFKSNYYFKEKEQSLQNVVIGVLLGTIAALVVGIGILFLHLKRKNKQRRISTINSETPRGNDYESGHYMEIYMIDDNIVTPWQENSNSNIAVERAVVENRDIALASGGHSSTSSDNDSNASVYLDDGYEHSYNTLFANNRAEDEHVYLSPKKTSNNANSTPFENAACGCSLEFTEQDYSPVQTKTPWEAIDGEENNESEI
ncbi:hemicentin-1-like [Mytilus californianus]|uniref:hemicentin-1-like n=1 Tax=Mytilus californianus TaxID=6549 RepID=UPI002247F8B9|nr:hemicentin-1-like [Mytilus californianus]